MLAGVYMGALLGQISLSHLHGMSESGKIHTNELGYFLLNQVIWWTWWSGYSGAYDATESC